MLSELAHQRKLVRQKMQNFANIYHMDRGKSACQISKITTVAKSQEIYLIECKVLWNIKRL